VRTRSSKRTAAAMPALQPGHATSYVDSWIFLRLIRVALPSSARRKRNERIACTAVRHGEDGAAGKPVVAAATASAELHSRRARPAAAMMTGRDFMSDLLGFREGEQNGP